MLVVLVAYTGGDDDMILIIIQGPLSSQLAAAFGCFIRRTKTPVHAGATEIMSVILQTRVPFWVLNIIRHLIFRVPKKGP